MSSSDLIGDAIAGCDDRTATRHPPRRVRTAGPTTTVVSVDLPVMPPVQPMLAKSVKGVPDPAKFGGLSFEPKWDGFRCLVFRTATRSS